MNRQQDCLLAVSVDESVMLMPKPTGVFAGGDTKRGASFIVWAIAEGRKMARGIDKYLHAGKSAKNAAERTTSNWVLASFNPSTYLEL